MGRMRGIVPLSLATAFGILNGVTIFQPAFAEQQKEKLPKGQNEEDAVPSNAPDPNEAPETAAENTYLSSQTNSESLPKSGGALSSLWSATTLLGGRTSETVEEAPKSTDVVEEVNSKSNR